MLCTSYDNSSSAKLPNTLSKLPKTMALLIKCCIVKYATDRLPRSPQTILQRQGGDGRRENLMHIKSDNYQMDAFDSHFMLPSIPHI